MVRQCSSPCAVVLPSAVHAAPTYTGQVVVNGLLNPRGVTVDPLGRILVHEGGSGGSACDVPGAPPGPPTALRCWGQTGAVVRYDPSTNTHSRPWSLLDSIAKSSNPYDLSPVGQRGRTHQGVAVQDVCINHRSFDVFAA